MKIDPQELITQAEAARIRGVTIQAINFLVKRGKLRTVEIGGRAFLYRSDIENFEPDPGGRPRKQPGSARKRPPIKST